ncbi:MAG: hypothetical protein HOY78_02530 [Saccharothrix sp.]|nr:hypothetical protein [Saccharothrix sp.]
MGNSNGADNARVIGGTLVLILALGGTETLLYHLGGLVAAVGVPALALLWWTGYRLVTVPVLDEWSGNGSGDENRAGAREQPRPDQPHTW